MRGRGRRWLIWSCVGAESLTIAILVFMTFILPRLGEWRYRTFYGGQDIDDMLAQAHRPPAMASRVVFDNGRIVRFNKRGEKLWSSPVGPDPTGRWEDPCYAPGEAHEINSFLHEGRLFITHKDGIVAFDDRTGQMLWDSPGRAGELSVRAGLLLCTGCCLDEAKNVWLVARNIENGEVAWELVLPHDAQPLEVVEAADLLLVRSWGGFHSSFTNFVDAGGRVLLRLPESVTYAHKQGEDILFVSNRRVARMALDGTIRWQVPVTKYWRSPYPFSCGEVARLLGDDDLLVYFYGPICDSGVEVCRLNPSNGQVRWRTYCMPLGVTHSAYSQSVCVRPSGSKVVVVSKGSYGTFVECLSLDSGKSKTRFEFPPPGPMKVFKLGDYQ